MAILTANAAIDMTDWNFDNITGGAITRHTPLQYFITGSDGFTHYQFTGAGLTYDGSNNLTGGLVTGYKVLDDDGDVLLNVSGFSVGAATVASAIASGDATDLFEDVFGDGDNTIHGSAADDFLTDTLGNDTIDAGAGDDLITLSHAGSNTILGGEGDDTLYVTAETFGTAFDGGDGTDMVILDRSHNYIMQLGDGAVSGIESLVLTGSASRNAILISDDTLAPAGGTFHIDASALGAASKLIVQADGEADGTIDVIGGLGNDTIVGGDFKDSFHLERGGSDHLQGGLGDDTFYMGAAFDAGDHLDGEDGTNDTVILDGNYAVGTTLGRHSFAGIELLLVQAGHNYKLIANDHNVAAGDSLTVAGIYLAGSDKLYFDGSAETDGSYAFNDGSGNDTFIGGAGDDIVTMVGGGHNILQTGAGDDDIQYINAFDTAETIDGGAGTDSVSVTGAVTGAFAATTIVNVEALELNGFFDSDFSLNDANVAAGKTLAIDGSAATALDTIKVDGSAELDGKLIIEGGEGDDTLTGGAKIDKLTGGGGADLLKGGLGKDTYVFGTAADSTGVNFDTIDGYSAQGDKLDVHFAVTGLDATINNGRLNDATFDADLASKADAAHLLANHAVLFKPSSGDHDGETFLVVDQNGVAGYDAGVDLVIRLLSPVHLNHLDIGDFI